MRLKIDPWEYFFKVRQQASMTLEYKAFEDHVVSTRTFVVVTNLTIDIDKMIRNIPITEWVYVAKKRGRKKKDDEPDPNKEVPIGSIITLKYKDVVKGVNLKPKKGKEVASCSCLGGGPHFAGCSCKKKPKSTYFRNSVTIVMVLDKHVNFKVSANGKFQITGCKLKEHATKCVEHIWVHLRNIPGSYTIQGSRPLTAISIPAMRNIDFDLGFLVNRHALDHYINTKTDTYFSTLQDAFGYAGVNIKFPIAQEQVKALKFDSIRWDPENSTWKHGKASYKLYYELLCEKDRKKADKKERSNTFLVFHSGKVIMSGMVSETMQEDYYKFLKMIASIRGLIEEKLR